MAIGVTCEEEKLLIRIAEGDEQAFSVLFYKYLPLLHPFVTRIVKSAYVTEEVIQNTFIRVWLNREKLEGVSNVRSWLYKYASNECLNHLRSLQQKGKVLAGFSETMTEPTHDFSTPDLVRIHEINELINRAVNKLPAQRRRIYMLSRRDGKSIPEIAIELGISPNTVKNTLVISLKSIREYLSKHGYTFSFLFLLFIKE